MNWQMIVGLAAVASAGAANATGSLVCDVKGDRPIRLTLVIGHTVVPTLLQPRLIEGGIEIPVVIAQSWIGNDEVRVDLTDPDMMQIELRLTVRRGRDQPANGNHYSGWARRNDERRAAECVGDG
jgi:hypothetical protein